MALNKRVKIGGGYYRGYKCAVASASGNYTALIVNTGGSAINSITITPDDYGAGDTMKVEHFSDVDGTGSCKAILAEDIHNCGANSSVQLDFPAAELVDKGECIKFTYINTASVAMNVYLIAEFMGMRKTA
jgi:hypothetical protein